MRGSDIGRTVTVRPMLDIRTITSDDVDLFRRRVSRGFGDDAEMTEEGRARFDAIFENDRTLAAFDEDDIVGTTAGFSLGLTVPGGANVAMGGTTVVTVQPTHRRQGLLRSLMDAHLDDVAAHDEPLAGLWASEGSIYGRFGYGLATFRHSLKVDTRTLEFRSPPPEGRLRMMEPEEADPLERHLYEQARTLRAGFLTRSDAWWSHRLIADPESWRDGMSEQRHLIYEESGVVTGYARFRQKSQWENFVADGKVDVIEIIALTDDARRGIWRLLTSIDLYPRVEAWNMPVDDPLPYEITDRRRVSHQVGDGLWLRLMDVPAAVQARSFDVEGSVVFEVTDPAGRDATAVYRLDVGGGDVLCEQVDEQPEIGFDADILGSLYLGGGDALAMASAGLIVGDEEVVTRFHRLMRTDQAPWCPDVF